jgi:hypothetical protein
MKSRNTIRAALREYGVSYKKVGYLDIEDVKKIPKRSVKEIPTRDRIYIEEYDSSLGVVTTKEFLSLANLTPKQLDTEMYKGTLEPASWELDASGHRVSKHWYKLDAEFFNDKVTGFESKTSDPVRFSTMDVWYDIFSVCPDKTVNGLEMYKILGRMRDGLRVSLKDWIVVFGSEEGYKAIWDLNTEKLPRRVQHG